MLLVIDGTWLFNRAAFTAKEPENIPWSLVSLACSDALFCRATQLLIAFDGASGFRYKLWPLYKANRKGKALTKNQLAEALKNRKLAASLAPTMDHRPIYEYMPLVQAYLTELGLSWVQYEQFEADDVLATYASKGNVIIDAPDKDMYQCLVPGVRILSTKYKNGKMRRHFITDQDVITKFGVPASDMILYQTLVGDRIDFIIGLTGPTTAVKWMNKYKTLEAIVQSEQLDVKHVQLNQKLVTLRTDVPYVLPKLGTCRASKAPKAYKEWIASLKRATLF